MADNEINLKCPACGKQMTKLYMRDAGVNIDICIDGCGGIYFDNRELEKFDESHEKVDDILKAIESKHFLKTEDSEVRICPICNTPMAKIGAANGEIQINVCNNCGGKFLDNGELQKIRQNENKTDTKIENLLNSMYEENLRELSVNNSRGLAGRGQRISFFETLAKKYFM